MRRRLPLAPLVFAALPATPAAAAAKNKPKPSIKFEGSPRQPLVRRPRGRGRGRRRDQRLLHDGRQSGAPPQLVADAYVRGIAMTHRRRQASLSGGHTSKPHFHTYRQLGTGTPTSL